MKIAIITGASSGMGKEMVLQLSDRFGWLDEIWVIARRADILNQLRSQVTKPLRVFGLDLTDTSALQQIEQALAAHRPEVMFLVNSAGFGKIGSIGEMESFYESGMIRLNCEALCNITHLVLPYLVKNSRIIQLASSAAFLPQPKFAIYAATKSFVLSYSRSLGQELKKKDIYVTAVCPGPVKTEFFEIAETTGKIPLYKVMAMADPKKVVRLAIHDSIMKKSISVYGVMMKLFHLTSKLIPHDLLLSIIGALTN